MNQHKYAIEIEWTGNQGPGTKTYSGYRRDHTISSPGKCPILVSSDPAFRGDASRYNPEELLVASLSSCHMLWYLHLCSANLVVVSSYRDRATGSMRVSEDGSGAFNGVTLRPQVRIAADSDAAKALHLHEEAHRLCFIANSINFGVDIVPEISKIEGSPAWGDGS